MRGYLSRFEVALYAYILKVLVLLQQSLGNSCVSIIDVIFQALLERLREENYVREGERNCGERVKVKKGKR